MTAPAPMPDKRTMPRRPPNSELRTREYLTPDEVDRLIKAAKQSPRCGARDAALILVCYRHGLRVGELVGLRWEQIDLEGAVIHVRRAKRGTPSVQPLAGVELRALRPLRRANPRSPYVFLGMGGAPLTVDAVRRLMQRAGLAAGLDLSVHPHMLRHGAGYKLANDGVDTRTIQAYLGHRHIDSTVRYTELAPGRFAGLWQE